MAISHVGSLADGTANRTTTTSITLNFATQADDLIIVAMTNGGADADPNTPAGTIVTTGGVTFNKHTSLGGGASTDMNGSVWYAWATGNHNGQTITGSGFTNSAADVVTVLRGAHRTTPFLATTSALCAQGTDSMAGITSGSTGNCWLVLTLHCDDNIASDTEAATNPATITERAEHLSSGGVDTAATICAAAQSSAGATGTISWANARAAGIYMVAIAVLVQPASGDGTATPAAVAATVTFPTTGGGGGATPVEQSHAVTIPAVVLSSSGTPDAVAAVTTPNAPTGDAGGTVDELARVATVGAPAGGAGATASVVDVVLNAIEGWTPANLSNVVDYWLADEALTITESGGSVSEWRGLLGAHHFEQATAGNQPGWGTRTLNGLYVVDSANYDYMTLDSSPALSQPFTIWEIGYWDQIQYWTMLWSANVYAQWSASAIPAVYAGTGINAAVQEQTRPAWKAVLFNGASSKVYVNGTEYSLSGDIGSNSLGVFTIGSEGSDQDHGAIAAYVIQAGAPSADDLTNMDTFAARWGI